MEDHKKNDEVRSPIQEEVETECLVLHRNFEGNLRACEEKPDNRILSSNELCS